MARIVMTVDSADSIAANTEVRLRDVADPDQLAEAEANGSIVYALDDETGLPGPVLFDGHRWLTPRPTYEAKQDIAVPTVDMVQLNTEVVQSEVEAILSVMAEAVADKVPAKTIRALQRNVATARIAMHDGDTVAAANVAQELSATPETSLFSVERAKEVAVGNQQI